MPGYEFDWDDENVGHIARHGLEPEDVVEIFTRRHVVLRGRRGRHLAYGRTEAGRHIVVVFERSPGRTIRAITARDMTRNERRRFAQLLA